MNEGDGGQCEKENCNHTSGGPTEDSLILRGGQQFGMRGTGEGILDHNARFTNVLQAALLVFLQAATQKITDQPWSLPGQCFERRLLHHDGSQNFRYVFTMERLLTRQHFVQHRTERPDVGAPVHSLTACLLWTHVGRGSDNDSSVGRCHAESGRVG